MPLSVNYMLRTSVVMLSVTLAACDGSSSGNKTGNASSGNGETTTQNSTFNPIDTNDVVDTGNNDERDVAEQSGGENTVPPTPVIPDAEDTASTFERPVEQFAGSYHIDCEAKEADLHAQSDLGTRARPMTSLDQINAVKLEPGNKVLFKRGSTCYGMFKPLAGSTGSEGKPIILSAYGEKELGRPVIAAGCKNVKQPGVLYPVEEHKLSNFVAVPNRAFPADSLLANIKPYESNCADDEKPTNLAAVHLFNTEYWEIDTLELTNDATTSGNRLGLFVQLEDFGTGHHYKVRDVYVHHVRGRVQDNDGLKNTYKTTGGIMFNATRDTEVYGKPQKKTTFDGILVEHSEIYEVDPIALATRSSWMCRHEGAPCGDYEPYLSNKQGGMLRQDIRAIARNDYTPMTNVVIRQNKIHNNGGDAIIVRTSTKPLIEGNLIYDNWLRVPGNSAAAWTINSDGAIFQYNEVARTRLQHYAKTNADGMAFDADLGARDTTFRYNLTYENQGGTLLLCGCGADNIGSTAYTVGTVFTKNLSIGDGDKLILGAGSTNTRVSDNIFINPKDTPMNGMMRIDANSRNQFRISNNQFYIERTDLPMLFQENERATDIKWDNVIFGANQFFGIELKPDSLSSKRYNQSAELAKDTFAPYDTNTDFEKIVADWITETEFEQHRYKPLTQ